MSNIIEQPPVGTAPELKEYLSRIFLNVDIELNRKDKLSISFNTPSKPLIGKLYYFGRAVPADPDITAEGLYIFKSTGWVFLG